MLTGWLSVPEIGDWGTPSTPGERTASRDGAVPDAAPGPGAMPPVGAVVGIGITEGETGGTTLVGVTDTPGVDGPCPALPEGASGAGADGSAVWACATDMVNASRAHPSRAVQYSCERFALITMGDENHPGNEVIVG